ncbi:tRNA lysidine(34) synthetase TilS [bacterium]|nr:tRNA lysidine(34) synthetase TilS [bacterium]MCI0603911.1 tRNA lysidine(34) synthetase TilS [bacterium]
MIVNKVRLFIKKHSLIVPGERVLVAYSGGPDSTFLLMALKEIHPDVAAVYVNHQLRGRESKQEEKFVRQFCEEKKIPLFVERIAWKKRPADLEQSARKRRYRHLAKVAKEHGFHKVALAHHKDDAVETFLLHLVRGAGPDGLSGMQLHRDIYIRPLLECRRTEILHYLQKNQIAFFTDRSNKKSKFRRNRIRNQLIPYLEKHFNPEFSEAIHRTATWIGELNHLLNKLLQPYEKIMEEKEGHWILNRNNWLRLSPPLQKALLRRLLCKISGDLRLNARTLQNLVTCIQNQREMELPGFVKVCYKEGAIRFVRKEERIGFTEMDVPSSGKYLFPAAKVTLDFSVLLKQDFAPGPNLAYLDADKASFPLYIRNWKKGDSFRPLGMKGHKKLSDFLIDRKVPRNSRKQIPLVYKNDDLVWVAGHQIHHDYRVTDSTKKLLRIEARQSV